MTAHTRLKNEITEDEKCQNLMSWLVFAQYADAVSTAKNDYYQNRINPHLPNGPVHPYQLDESFSSSAASDLGLHCLCPKMGR